MPIVDLVSYTHLLISQGISMTVVLVRVAMGVSYEHNTTRTLNSMNSSRPIQLKPFASESNVGKSDSPV